MLSDAIAIEDVLLICCVIGYKDGACFEKGSDTDEGKAIDYGCWMALRVVSLRYGYR